MINFSKLPVYEEGCYCALHSSSNTSSYLPLYTYPKSNLTHQQQLPINWARIKVAWEGGFKRGMWCYYVLLAK